ncbi:MAG: GatB/YqeY domain-containing protein [Deltaproteobacteria bacterium]|nr:GatB/YqeY domain-containing protein [Deltaproteobacteria bacterium]
MATEAMLRDDLQTAMKAREMATVYVLRGLLAAIANQRIEKSGAELGAAEILALTQREAKQREEAEAYARKAGRDDLVTQNSAERAILARYLPAQLEDAELANLVRSWLADGLRAMGSIMARLKERHAGQYDGKRASEIVRSILASNG